MAKKLSYADLAATHEQATRRLHVLEVVSTDIADDTYRHRDGRDVYTWKAYRLTGCAGGYLVCVFDGFVNKRKSLFYVEHLDTAAQQVRERGSIFRDCGMAD